MLTLPIKKKWFDMIKSGEKKEEYREIKSYWTKRLGFEDKGTGRVLSVERYVLFRNGYSSNSPTIKCKVSIYQDYGVPSWGASIGEVYYVLKILSVEELC